MGLHFRGRRLQSGAVAEASGRLDVKAPANCRLISQWRIVEADLWDRAHLDLCGPATLTITTQGGEIAFGALKAGLEVEYARDSIGFCWAGCEESDEVEGEGTAELLEDGTIEIEFPSHNGDEAVLKAKRDPSSTPCYGSGRSCVMGPKPKLFTGGFSARGPISSGPIQPPVHVRAISRGCRAGSGSRH
jgi:hypothetical protein